MKTDKNTLPVVVDSEIISRRTSWQNREIQIAEIDDAANGGFPEYFHTNDYAILFVTHGTLCGQFNEIDIDLQAPAIVYIFNDHVLHYKSSTPDLRVRMLGYSPVIAEELALQLSFDKIGYAYVRPVTNIDVPDMQIAMHYLDLIEELLHKDLPNQRTTLLNLIRSLIIFLIDFFAEKVSSQKQFSRAEDIVGRFLFLVDNHCHEHHAINWYAEELCLTPKYVANVVKSVIGKTAGDCINENLVRLAKSLLVTSTLTIQQISDRLGFQNQSHFGTFFRRATGVSPREYRERKQ